MPIKIIKTHYVRHGPDACNSSYDHLFWEVELDEPTTDHADFQQRFQRDDIWQVGIAGQGIKRLTYKLGSDSVLDQLVYMPKQQQTEFIRLAKGEHDEYVKTRWYRDADYYVNDPDVETTTTIYRDQVGFEMGIHLDNSHVMLQAVINLSDNETGTELYAVDSAQPVYTMTGQRNRGIWI